MIDFLRYLWACLCDRDRDRAGGPDDPDTPNERIEP